MYVMKFIDGLSCYSYGDHPKKYHFTDLIKNDETNLFVYQQQDQIINLDLKGIEYFIEFETPIDQKYINFGNVHELISYNQIKDFSFRSSLTSKLSNFDSFNDKWIIEIKKEMNSDESIIDTKEILKIDTKEIFQQDDLQFLSKYCCSEENKEKKEMKKILATEYVFGNKDLLDSLYKRFSIDIDERSTSNSSQPDIILNSTHCVIFCEPDQLLEDSMDDFLERFAYLSLQFDHCLIIVNFTNDK